LAPITRRANFIALQIKGTKTGIAASVTGFIQTVSAGAISFFAVKLTDTGMGFDRTLGVSTLTLAILSLLVVTTMKVTQWKTGKKRNTEVLKYKVRVFSEHINELVVVKREGKEITLGDGRKWWNLSHARILG
jgi:DHA1 family bicyclomycin/chloramphenicol resistance-like MFS transporter